MTLYIIHLKTFVQICFVGLGSSRWSMTRSFVVCRYILESKHKLRIAGTCVFSINLSPAVRNLLLSVSCVKFLWHGTGFTVCQSEDGCHVMTETVRIFLTFYRNVTSKTPYGISYICWVRIWMPVKYINYLTGQQQNWCRSKYRHS